VRWGQIGLWPHGDGRASVGYWVTASARRRGVPRRALQIVSVWALALPGIHRLELYVEPLNEGSWRAADRSDYTRERLPRRWQTVGDQRGDMCMYSSLRAKPPTCYR
jgi:[ribosomal protein S5]-alanine N-acetyltransferase